MTDFLKCRLNPDRSDYAKQVEKVGREEIERENRRQEKFREAQAFKAREESG